MPKIIPQPDKEILLDLYITQCLSAIRIAELFGVSQKTVLRWLSRYNIPTRGQGNGLLAHGKQGPPNRDELMNWVHQEHLTYDQIGVKFGVTKEAVYVWMKKYNIPPQSFYESRHMEKPNLPSIEEFLEMYQQRKIPLRMIAKQFNTSPDTLARYCKKQAIQLRHDGFNGGHRFVCQDGHFARSIYEQRVDDWLFEHGIEHVIEPLLPFDRRYRADFLANGWYIEIWGIRTNKTYVQRRLQKTKQYREHGLPLLEIYEYHFDGRRNEPWARRLQAVFSASS